MVKKKFSYILASSSSFPALASAANSTLESEKSYHVKSTHHQHHIWGPLIISILSILVVASLLFCIKKKLLPISRQRWMKRKGSLKAEKLMLRRFQLEELVRATNNFSGDCLLGSGAFGNVYKGTVDNEETLAIKRAHVESCQSVEEFRNEVMLLARVKHRNLVGLVGFCEEAGGARAKGAKALVYEYVPNGSLLDYIIGRGGRCLTWRQRVNIAIGAAKGIAHLHDGIKPSIIHRDIKPSNILVGDGFEAKVSDFGLVRMGPIGDQSYVSSQIKGTPGYLDPAYCSSFHLSPFSDVYSFGVILLQLVAARPAVDITNSNSKYHIIEWARPSIERGNIEDIVDANLLTEPQAEPCNMEIMLKMAQLGLTCVEKVPKNRPTMTQVWQELEEALYSVDNLINKPPSSRNSRRSSSGLRRSREQGEGGRSSTDHEYHSQSFVSIDGVGFQRFLVEMDSLSFQSINLRCLETDSISLEIDRTNLKGITEETSSEH